MTHNLVVFYNTADTVHEGQALWGANPKLWPTYLMLGVASLSSILCTIVLLAYFWGTKAANKWNTARFGLSLFTMGFMMVMWAFAAGGMEGTSGIDASIWSQACDATDQKKSIFGHEVNFNQFCLEQVVPLSILMTGMEYYLCRDWNWIGNFDGNFLCLCLFEIKT
jgi:hypothetical protein